MLFYKNKNGSGVKTLGEAVLRNAKINRAYLELFYMNSKMNTPVGSEVLPMTWLGSAALGSYSVGKQLMYALNKKIKSSPKNYALVIDRYNAMGVNSQIRDINTYMTKYTGMWARMYPYYKTLGDGNRAVFDHIFWQFLVAHYCGGGLVVKYLDDKPNSLKTKLNISAWNFYSRDKKYMSSSLKLLRLEQEHVLQSLLYSGTFARYFTMMKRFNQYALPGIDKSQRDILNFDEFSAIKNQPANISYLESRMNWVKYLIIEHSKYFYNKYSSGSLESAFSSIDKQVNFVHAFYK